MKKVLIIGSGGREHALARAFEASPQVQKVYVAPANQGMLKDAKKIQALPIGGTDCQKLVDFAREVGVDLTFVGPEESLTAGVVDAFRAEGLAIVGPSQAAAQLESSKRFAKEIMAQAGVQTAAYRTFKSKDLAEALAYVETLNLPLVLKLDGLAQGKGVVIAQTLAQAQKHLKLMLAGTDQEVLVEEFLEGEEFSYFSLVNGQHVLPLLSARDYKRVGEGDRGPNTGGMGAYAPIPWFQAAEEERVLEEIVRPVAAAMVAAGTPYTGVLYTGGMWTKDGPKVIEFNARFGDPETQVILPLIEGDFYDLVQAHLDQRDYHLKLKDQRTVGVVLAAEGYPCPTHQGMKLEIEADLPWEQIYSSGLVGSEGGSLCAKGGRIAMTVGQAATFEAARAEAYELIDQLQLAHSFCRQDIGQGINDAMTLDVESKELVMSEAKIAIVMGSSSDWDQVKGACELLDELGLPYHKEVVSAHRMPDEMFAFAKSARKRGFQVIIAAAGGAAHLPGMIASQTTLPVIGIPMRSSQLNGMDSLLSIVQMPAGVPVGTMAIGPAGAKNAALYALRILAVEDAALAQALEDYQEDQRQAAVAMTQELDHESD